MRRSMVMLAALAVLTLGPPSRAQTPASEESLQVAHDTVVNAVKTGNLAMLTGLIHRKAMGFFEDGQMLARLRPGSSPQELLSPVVADVSKFASSPVETDYRVVGDTGVVCITAAVKDPKSSTQYLRVSYVYVFVEGNWRLLSWHSSQVPLKR